MLFVCLSHCAMSYFDFWRPSRPHVALEALGQIGTTISLVATPTFLLLSGIVVGYLWRVNPTSLSGLKRKLLDRGLFLLVVGHVLQVVPAAVQLDSWPAALQFSFVTDAIAAAIIIGPSCVTAMRARNRLILGLALLVVSWTANCLWQPSAAIAVTLSRYAFGTPFLDLLPGFPALPWLAVYLFGTAVGELVGAGGSAMAAQWLLLRFGAASLAIGLPLGIARRLARLRYPDIITKHDVISGLVSLTRKFPPGPTYLLVFGGAGLLLIAAAFAVAGSSVMTPLKRALASLGRASLLVFVLQGYVYYLLMPTISERWPLYWPIYYVTSLGLFLLAATVWNRWDGNRFLTVGLWRTTAAIEVEGEPAEEVSAVPALSS